MLEFVKIAIDEGAYMPVRAHATDAGADIMTPHDVVVPVRGSATVRTGVHIELPPNTAGMLKSKSGLNVNHNIISGGVIEADRDVLSDGVIDAGYSGEIVVKLYNLGDEPVRLPAGSKITKLVIIPVALPTFVLVDGVEAGERGDAGFGSTGA